MEHRWEPELLVVAAITFLLVSGGIWAMAEIGVRVAMAITDH